MRSVPIASKAAGIASDLARDEDKIPVVHDVLIGAAGKPVGDC